MAAVTPGKIELPRNLRGRSIHSNVIPTVSNLKNMIEKLILVDGDVNQLKQWEKRSYSAYQVDKIKQPVMKAATKEIKVNIIKQHILDRDLNEFGPSCIDIYLVAYVAENIKPGKQAFIEYAMKNGITDKLNSAQAIWQVGKGDGTYLGVLNEDGSVRDWDFFRSWINNPANLENKQPVKVYNKLVRDRIPEVIKSTGKAYKIRQLTNQEYIIELEKKAYEELDEYVSSKDNEERREELADLLEVIHSIAEHHGYSIHDIEETRKQKEDSRGGFRERIYLIDVED